MSTPGAPSLPDNVNEADWAEQEVTADPVTGEAGAPGTRSVTDNSLSHEASEADIRRLCEEAAQFRFASVCVNPTWVRAAVCNLRGTGVPVCTVIGFPLGANLADVKAYEARRAIFDGAREVDMVINVGALKSGMAPVCSAHHSLAARASA